MPTTVKTVWMFRDNSGTGWQEVHYWNSDSLDPNLGVRLALMVDVIAPARALILGGDCFCIGARASYPRTGANASLSKKFYLQGQMDEPGCSQSLSLATKWVDSTNTRRKTTHLRGFWDSVEANGEYHPEGGAANGWQEKFNNWKQLLIDGQFGWPTKDPGTSSKGNVSNYTSSATGHITFTLEGDGLPLATVGTLQQVRFSKLNSGSSPLNDEVLVEVLTRNSVRSVRQLAAGPFTGQGKYNYRGTTFVRYAQVYDASLGRRQQGRPIGLPPGRSQVRARY